MIKKNNNTNRVREWKFTIYISIIKRLFQARKLNNCEWERIDYTHNHSHTLTHSHTHKQNHTHRDKTRLEHNFLVEWIKERKKKSAVKKILYIDENLFSIFPFADY